MADVNSLTYLIYSLLTLTPHNSPTTDPSLKAWESTSEPSLNTAWHQDPNPYTGNYNAETCPDGEKWDNCGAHCQKTCKNYYENNICPQVCMSGCVCEDPDYVRDSDGKCIPRSSCEYTDDSPVTRYDRDRRTTYADEDYTDPPVTRYNDRRRRTTYADEENTDVPVTRYNNRDRRTTYADEDYTDVPVTRYYRGRRTTYVHEDYTDATPEPFDEVTPDEPDWTRETRNSPVTRYNDRRRRTTYADEENTDATPEPFDEVTPDEPDWSRETRNELKSESCPNRTACFTSCKNKGFRWGACTGKQHAECECFPKSPIRPSTVHPNEIDPYTKFRSDDNENCPDGEEWSECNYLCQQTCKNRDQPVICPKMCVPGCVCEQPGEVRDSDGTCVPPPLCKDTGVQPDEAEPVTYDPRNPDKLNSGECNPSNCDNGCRQKGYMSGSCNGRDNKICQCYRYIPRNRYSTEDPDERAPPTRYYSVDPDEVDHTEDPRVTFNPDEIGRSARYPESVDSDEVDHTEDPRITFNPDEIGRAARDPETGSLSKENCSDAECMVQCKKENKDFGFCMVKKESKKDKYCVCM